MTFASPYLLLALTLLPLVAVLSVWFERRATRYSVSFTNLDVLATVLDTGRSWRRRIPLALFLCALAAAVAALARPQTILGSATSGATIVLLVDVSGSMSTTDIKPSRLAAAQAAMDTFSRDVPRSVRLALVSFSSAPYEAVAPTTNRELLQQGIQLLTPEGGTAIGDALALAVQVATPALKNGTRRNHARPTAAIVLLSDGAQNQGTLTPLQGAALAAREGIRVYTVVLGTDHGSLTIDNYGLGVTESLPVLPDPITLAAIARATGGRTYRVETAARVESVYHELGSSLARRRSTREISSWFSGAGALLLLFSLGAGSVLRERLP